MGLLFINLYFLNNNFIINIKLTSILFLFLISLHNNWKIISNKVLINSKSIVNLINNIIKIIQESFGQIRDIILNNNIIFIFKLEK